MEQAMVVVITTLSIVVLSYIYLFFRYKWECVAYKKWKSGLTKGNLLESEKELFACMERLNVKVDTPCKVEQMIFQQNYKIRESPFLFLREAYTTKAPQRVVVVRKFLPKERRNFALVHELMHIIYKPEQLGEHHQGRGVHCLFIRRDLEEQKRDYMAASLLLPKDTFWHELEEASFFTLKADEQKQFIYKTAKNYMVPTDTVLRRIQELRVLKGPDFAR